MFRLRGRHLPQLGCLDVLIEFHRMLGSAMREPSSLSRSILIQKDEDLLEEDYPTDVAFLDQAQPAPSHHQHLINHSAPAILRSISGQGLNIIDDYLLRTPASSKVLRQ